MTGSGLYTNSLEQIVTLAMSSHGGSNGGGSRLAAGRRTDPVRNHFETVPIPENMGRAPRDQQVRCKSCMERISARPDRMEKHLDKCKSRS